MSITASEIMTSPVTTVSPHTGVQEIARLLSERGISAVPVIEANGDLAGLVSEEDLIRPFRESARLRRDWWLDILAAGETLSQQFVDYVRRDTRTAADVMVRDVVTADERATLPQIAEMMVTHHVKRIPILRGGRLVGIVSRPDLVRSLARAPAMLV